MGPGVLENREVLVTCVFSMIGMGGALVADP